MNVFIRYIVIGLVVLFSIGGLLGPWLLGFLYGTVRGRYNAETEMYEVWWDKTGFRCVNGHFRIKMYTPLKKHGLCDTTGRIIVPLRYDEVGDMDTNGLVLIGNKGKYGVSNSRGELVVPVRYSHIRIWSRYIRVANDSIGGSQGMKMKAFDLSGRTVLLVSGNKRNK